VTKDYVLAISSRYHLNAPEFARRATDSFAAHGFALKVIQGVKIEEAAGFDTEHLITHGDLWALWARGEGLRLDKPDELIQCALMETCFP
jgi:hypothetical protein